jgi:small GTP-binding protein
MTDENQEENEIEILPDNIPKKPHYIFKVIVIGSSGVGKTSLTIRALKNEFNLLVNPTIGFEFLTMKLKYCDKIIALQIWDTCGQEIYQSVISRFYKRASMALLVYSIADKKTFLDLNKWLEEIKNNCDSDIKIALVGNKIDLQDSRDVTKEEALEFKEKNNLDLIFESSAKHGDNSKDIFFETAKLLYKNYNLIERNNSIRSKKSVKKEREPSFSLKKNSIKKKSLKKNNISNYDDEDDLYMESDKNNNHGSMCCK